MTCKNNDFRNCVVPYPISPSIVRIPVCTGGFLWSVQQAGRISNLPVLLGRPAELRNTPEESPCIYFCPTPFTYAFITSFASNCSRYYSNMLLLEAPSLNSSNYFAMRFIAHPYNSSSVDKRHFFIHRGI
jgi:hypothetical protein